MDICQEEISEDEEQKVKIQLFENIDPIKTTKTKNKEKIRNPAESILQHLTNEERISVLQKLTHNIIPGFNINKTKHDSKNLSNYPLFQCTIPQSIYTSSEHPNKFDLCYKRTAEHFNYTNQLNRQKAFYEISEKQKYFKKSIKKDVYPYTVIKYAEMLENNPDEYFQSRYDWYYTGGNLKCNSNNNLIYHSQGSNLNKLVLSRLKKKSKSHYLKPNVTMDLLPLNILENSEIFEIQSLALKNRFSIRQKYLISLLTYDDNDLVVEYIISSNKIPFITSAGDDFDSTILATGNLNREVFLWDVKNSTSIPKQKLFENNLHNNIKSRNWNCLCCMDNNLFGFTTLNEFCLLDCRLSVKESQNNLCDFSKYQEICENISSLAKSNYNNIIYFGTTHKIFTVDTRFMYKEMSNKYIVQRWIHQMESVPLMLKPYICSENYELLAMSSSLSGDIRICENFSKLKSNKSKYSSTCLPYMPPSLIDGYKIAKMYGECLDPVTNLEKRINSCTTGLDFLIKSDKIYLLISNSLGDVFSTKLNFDEDIKYSDYNNVQIMVKNNEIVKLMLEKNNSNLNLTEFVELRGMDKILRCKRLNNAKNLLDSCSNNDQASINIVNGDDEPIRPQRRAKWQKSINELYSYKDVLASNLLAVWDMEITEEKDILPVVNKKNKKQHDIIKVKDWLNESIFSNSPLPFEEIAADKDTIILNNLIQYKLESKSPEQNIEEHQMQNNNILGDSFAIDTTLKTFSQYENIKCDEIEIDDSFDITKVILPAIDIPRAILVDNSPKPKIGEKRKRSYVKGF